jgi:CTP:molybdopterin cytidylyltransferase MocA
MALTGDTGGRQLIKKYSDRVVTFPPIPAHQSLDIDTEKDYQKVLAKWQLKHS